MRLAWEGAVTVKRSGMNMSLELEGAATVASAVAAASVGTAAAAATAIGATVFGAGWLAWQSGKLLLAANEKAGQLIEDSRQREEEAKRQEKIRAVSSHEQLVKMGKQFIMQSEKGVSQIREADRTEWENQLSELRKYCLQSIPEETYEIEKCSAELYLLIEKITRKNERFQELKVVEDATQQETTIAQLMKDLRVAFDSMEIHELRGENVTAVDGQVIKRKVLNQRLSAVTGRIGQAVQFIENVVENYGVDGTRIMGFLSCFSGTEQQLQKLCSPTISNQELEKGIKRLEENMHMFEMFYPTLAGDIEKIDLLYPVYVQAAEALGEKVEEMKFFPSSEEIEEKLHYFEKRSLKAQQCSEIYETLGESAYICYALDTELEKMGYQVHQREEIMRLVGFMPQAGKLGENDLPFYRWNQEELTQLYTMAEECHVQLIVNDNGSVSVQTFSGDTVSEEYIKNVQKKHCQQMQELRRRLQENWFIRFPFEEKQGSDVIVSETQWQEDEKNEWTERTHRHEGRKEKESNRNNQVLRK